MMRLTLCYGVLGALSLLSSSTHAGYPTSDGITGGGGDGQRQRERKCIGERGDDADGAGGGHVRPGLVPARPPPIEDAPGDEGDTVKVLIKYRNSAGRTKIASFGRNGNFNVRLDKYNMASIETDRRNIETLRNDPNIERVTMVKQVDAQVLRGSQHVTAEERARRLAESIPYGIPMVQADQVSPGPISVKVCVVDTGYGVGHPDLPTKITHGVNGWNANNYPAWDVDKHSHGTHCAGTIEAIGNNNNGVIGVNEDPTKFTFFITKGLNDNGSGSSDNVLAAVNKCVENEADVISMSLGGGGDGDDNEAEVYEDVYNSNVLVVAAAGNGGDDDPLWPASYPTVMSVAAVSSGGNHASFSQTHEQVEIAAPGVSVLSTTTTNQGMKWSYSSWDGTSMATPHVAGVAAKLLSHFSCTAHQIRNVMIHTAEDRGSVGCNSQYGHGIVKAKAAYDYITAHGCDAAGGIAPTLPSDRALGGCAQLSTIDLPPPPPSPPPPPTDAVYDSSYGAPGCLIEVEFCDSNGLLNGRAGLGPEPNEPNTMGNCPDGRRGTYYNDESIEHVKVTSTDEQAMKMGNTVSIQVTAHAWGGGDRVDLFHAANADSPTWVHLGTWNPSFKGIHTYMTVTTLSSSALQAVRANIRWQGSLPDDGCGGGDLSGNWDDTDDLVFAVASFCDEECGEGSICVGGVCSSEAPSMSPSVITSSPTASRVPSSQPSESMSPSEQPSMHPSNTASMIPTQQPSQQPSGEPSFAPSGSPSGIPSSGPSIHPSTTPSQSSMPSVGTVPQVWEATYDSNLRVPSCVTQGIGCDTVDLVFGRGASMGPPQDPYEVNQPNTIKDSCADGTHSVNYYLDWESVEQITVRTVDGSNMQGGSEVVVEAEVWAWSSGNEDAADFYHTADATAQTVDWVFIGTIVPPGGGRQILTQQYNLPDGGGSMHAVRVNFRWQGTSSSASTCSGGLYSDTDDLAFAVA